MIVGDDNEVQVSFDDVWSGNSVAFSIEILYSFHNI
jgi:hypothetical protein